MHATNQPTRIELTISFCFVCFLGPRSVEPFAAKLWGQFESFPPREQWNCFAQSMNVPLLDWFGWDDPAGFIDCIVNTPVTVINCECSHRALDLGLGLNVSRGRVHHCHCRITACSDEVGADPNKTVEYLDAWCVHVKWTLISRRNDTERRSSSTKQTWPNQNVFGHGMTTKSNTLNELARE